MEGEEPSMEGMGGPSPPPAEEPSGPSPPPGQEPSGPSPPPAEEPSGPSPSGRGASARPPPAEEPSGPSPPPGQEPSGSSPPPAEEPSGRPPPAEEPRARPRQARSLGLVPSGRGVSARPPPAEEPRLVPRQARSQESRARPSGRGALGPVPPARPGALGPVPPSGRGVSARPPPGQEPSGPSPTPAEEPSGPSPPPAEEPSGSSPPPGQESSGPSCSLAEAPAGAGVGADEQEEVEVTDSHTQTKHKPQGGAKKKAAKKAAVGYSVRPIVPARRAELVAVAKAMHREQFGREVQELFHLEREAALKAMQTGLYIGWRCPEYLWDCFRVGDLSKCFCGHLLREHQVYVETCARVPCTVPSCKCQSFIFIPSRPEDVGEFWLRKRVGFDPSTWRATCRCKHSHEQHAPSASRACRATGCWCVSFESNFLCAACDRCWEEHETFFETAETRRKGGRPYGEAYLPFAEMPELRNAVLLGHPGHSSAPQAPLGELPAPPSHALPFPSPGLRRPAKQSGKKA
ncbi:protein FAM221B [Mauremys reevesii]|uniref:protein FAM221B n=1 Tax=Mauremys reevesii TaxID=260615 RepID=UPI00193F31E0|nr:protein FAM221B [Mauremys reevesii]